MRYGIISDIHGNLVALDAVIAAADRLAGGPPDGWICLGDVVGYGSQPNECVDRVRSLCETTLIGNHDLAAIHQLDISWFNPYARAAAEWTRENLSTESAAFLQGLPETRTSVEWDATFSHGSLTDPPRDYILTCSDARVNFKLLETSVLFIGHSHLSKYFVTQQGETYCDEEIFRGRGQVTLRPGFRYIVNSGSVGQPRDGDPRAALGVFDVEARSVEVLRVVYDIGKAQKMIRAAGLPPFIAERLELGM